MWLVGSLSDAGWTDKVRRYQTVPARYHAAHAEWYSEMPIRSTNQPSELLNDIGRSPALLHRILAVLTAFFAILIPAILVILLIPNVGRGAWDATVYHEPFIRQLAPDLFKPDLSNPLTATTPGYHILMACLVAIGAGSVTILRIASAFIGAMFIALLCSWLVKRVRPLDALLLSIPIACSIYTFQAAAWLLPDNLAWLGVLAIIAMCLRDAPGWKTISIAGAVLAALVLTRQVHLWAASVIWLAAWLGVRENNAGLFTNLSARIPRTLIAMLITLPAFGAVAWFINHWGGAVPPRFQGDMSGGNPATPGFILVQTVILTVGFGPWLLPACLKLLRDHRRVALLAISIGLVLATIPTTTLDPDAGRYSGWWAIVGKAPVLIGRTSIVFLVFAPIGALIIAGALSTISHRARWTLLGALVAFAVAQSATAYSWQRYHEPFLILLLGMLAALQPSELRLTPLAKLRIPAMLALCFGLVAISMGGLRGEPVVPGTPPPPEHTSPTDPWFDPESAPGIQIEDE